MPKVVQSIAIFIYPLTLVRKLTFGRGDCRLINFLSRSSNFSALRGAPILPL